MKLNEELLAKAIGREVMRFALPYLQQHATEIVERQSYQALQEIKAIIEDDSLDRPACFMRVEEIVRVFERIGSSGGNRHDF